MENEGVSIRTHFGSLQNSDCRNWIHSNSRDSSAKRNTRNRERESLTHLSELMSLGANQRCREPKTFRLNSYYLYTKALSATESGVVAVPSRFKWSIETSWSGIDAQGKDLPDTRVMMRLYDPDQNFTALTAQMDLATAEKLQRELADIIAKKRKNADYQYRPQLYDSSLIPTGDARPSLKVRTQ